MEISSEIRGIHDELIRITAHNVKEYNLAVNSLARKPTDTDVKADALKISSKTSVSKRRRTKKLSKGITRQIKSMRLDGMSSAAISRKLNIPYGMVYSRASSIKPRTKKEKQTLSNQQQLISARKRHAVKTPDYHIMCPACDSTCDIPYENFRLRALRNSASNARDARRKGNSSSQE